MKINILRDRLLTLLLGFKSYCQDSFVCPKYNESRGTNKKVNFSVIISSLLRHRIKQQGAFMVLLDCSKKEECCTLAQVAMISTRRWLQENFKTQ